MRRAASIAVAGLLALAACDARPAPAPPAPGPVPQLVPPPAVFATIDEERAANERAYRESYLPKKEYYLRDDSTRWVVIAGGRLIGSAAKFTTIGDADAAARGLASKAKHRFVFEPGEDGDREEFLGGTEKRYVLGNTFMAVWQGVAALGPHVTLLTKKDGVLLSSHWADGRPFVSAEIAPPIGEPVRTEEFVLATGYAGSAVVPSDAARTARLEMWEIPGIVKLSGTVQSGDCRRARARFHVPGAEPQVMVQVAIWPAEPR